MLLAVVAASTPARAATDGVITTDLAVSEWGASQSLVLNMRTGEYTVTAFPNTYPPTKPNARISQHGMLSRDELRKIQPAYSSALTRGLVDGECDGDPQQNHLIVGNGRVPSLTLKMGGKVYRAARSYQCWTPAAHALNRQLEDSFKPVSIWLSAKLRGVAEMTAPTASATAPPDVARFVLEHRLSRYSVALSDLNGDDRPEALIYAMATTGGQVDLCGSGGCALYVLSLSTTGYRQVASISISRPPVRVLPKVTHGWHDISVLVAGGGITSGYEARLSFNGRTYPSNPSTPPATRLKDAAGKVVIAAVPAIK
ncbi:hypothetical protein U1707_18345 [Sphingomonas sp. PB2P12]